MEELSKLSLDEDGSTGEVVAEPFRFTFEIAWEVAHKGINYTMTLVIILRIYYYIYFSGWHSYCH